MKAGVAAALALTMAGCLIPIPHTQARNPEIRGLVRDGPNPLAGVGVHLHATGSAGEKHFATESDAAGRFRFPSSSHWRYFEILVPLVTPHDRLYWTLTLTHGSDGTAREYVWRGSGFELVPSVLWLECDLTGPTHPYDRQGLWSQEPSVCRARDRESPDAATIGRSVAGDPLPR